MASKLISIYIPCKDKREAMRIGLHLLKKRLIACATVISGLESVYFWPPGKNKFAKEREVVILGHTLLRKFSRIEQVVRRLHSYEVPCILAIPISHTNPDYLDWVENEVA